MPFIDEIDIYVASGNGGNGATSISKNKNKAIQDGGNGGHGGNIYIIADKKKTELTNLNFKKTYNATNGEDGASNGKNGKNGKNIIITVPIGTLIYDNEEKRLLGELIHDKEKLLIVKGGIGGTGNKYLKKNTMQSTKSRKGIIKFIHLEMYLLADIGFIGKPNVGKSSLLNACTNKLSKVANYSFTTLKPTLGVLKVKCRKKIILADIPGILKNASRGKGLGFKFLKHIKKSKILFHIINIKKFSEENIKKEILITNKELTNFNKEISTQKKWLIINKIDLMTKININKIKKHKLLTQYNYEGIFCLSAYKKIGIKKLLFNIKECINSI